MKINEPVPFKIIGAGTFGRVFKIDANHVLKKTRQNDQSASDMLLNDFQQHVRIRERLKDCRVVSIPMVHGLVGMQDDFWKECRDLFEEAFSEPGFGLFTERIPPLDRHFRQALVEKYCPLRLQDAVLKNEASEDCLARIYLGRRRRERVNSRLANSLFSLRNYPLCLDQMEELGLPVEDLCRSMAQALSIMHWDIGVDARNVEFVLGGPSCREQPMLGVELGAKVRSDGSPQSGGCSYQDFQYKSERAEFNFRKPRACVWLLDFNQVERLKNDDFSRESILKNALDAFWDNDPYYPRPNEERLWQIFSQEYLGCCKSIDEDFPKRFLVGVEQEHQKRQQIHTSEF